MLRISCTFEASLSRSMLSDYRRDLDLSVIACDEFGAEYVLGKMAADLLLLGKAEADGESVFEICDEDSQGMYELYVALFDEKRQDFHRELRVREPTEYILFLWNAVLHPKLKPYHQAILHALSELFGVECVTILWRDVAELTDKQLAELGYSKISGTEFVFSHAMRDNEFANANPRGMLIDVDFDIDLTDEEWVLSRWKKRG